MAGVPKVSHGHDDVYEAVSVVNGGNLVIPANGATNAGVQGVAPAGAAATNVLGVAARRAEPVANQNLSGTDADGYPVSNVNSVNELTTVYKRCVVPVVYTAAAVAFGQKLVAAAGGAVAAAAAGTDAQAIVGECRQVGGVSAAGGSGLAYIY